MNDDGQGFAYGAGYEQATKNAQRKIDALVAALRRIENMSPGVDWSSRPDGMIGEARTIARAALKAATE